MSVNQTNKSTDKLKKALQSVKSALREIINDVGGTITDSTPFANYKGQAENHSISTYVANAIQDFYTDFTTELNNKVDKVQGKGLSENDFTDTSKSKLDNIEANAEVNAIEGVQVDGTDLTPNASKKVNVVISGKVDKTSGSNKVYGTDSSGNQKTFDVENTPGGDGVIVRRSNQTGEVGQIIVPLTPTRNGSATSKSYVDNLVATVKDDSYIVVNTTTYPTLNDFLATIGEDGDLYLYPIDTTDLTKGYYRYIYESNTWIHLGTTEIDLSDYYNKTETNALLNDKVNASDVYSKTDANSKFLQNPLTSVTVTDGGTISDQGLKDLITAHQPILINSRVGFFSTDDGTNYQYYNMIWDSVNSVNRLNIVTINKSTWEVTFHAQAVRDMSNPMTSAGDLIVGGASGTPIRLGKGNNGEILAVNESGNLAYTKSLPYLKTAPNADNPYGLIKVVLTSEPSTYYSGYEYTIIKED